MIHSERNLKSKFSSKSLVGLINIGQEFLWLLSIILIPILFLDSNTFSGEAKIANLEVPKVITLRCIVSSMVLLWLLELWVRYSTVTWIAAKIDRNRFRPYAILQFIRSLLGDRPGGWIILGVLAFASSTLISTLFSSSLHVSLWGEVPGQDGYSAYTLASYFLLFAVIATHLKSKQQLLRLLGAISISGLLMSGYSIFQYYQFDFLGMSGETSSQLLPNYSEGGKRVTSFQGNNLFAGSAMLVPIIATMTLSVAVLLSYEVWSSSAVRNFIKLWKIGLIFFISSWVLAIQIFGLIFSFSRGPWVSAIFSLIVFWGLLLMLLGFRSVLRLSVLLMVVSSLIMSILYWQGSINLFAIPNWIGIFVWCIGLLTGILIFVSWNRMYRVYVAVGGIAIIAISLWILNPFNNNSVGIQSDKSSDQSVITDAWNRLSSVYTEITGGLSGRYTHWAVSWEIIRDRPWAQSEDLSLKPIRAFIGYGPDMFRYVYLFKSPPSPPEYHPHEPDHAHNFLIHQTVEQGILGFVSIMAIAVSIGWVGFRLLTNSNIQISVVDKVIMLGILAAVVGKCLEMMVGVARVSDLTILSALLAGLTVFPNWYPATNAALVDKPASNHSRRPKNRYRFSRQRHGSVMNLASSFQFMIIGLLIVVFAFMVVFTWKNNINYVVAGLKASQGIDRYYAGNLQGSLRLFNDAISLAPTLSIYHNYRAGVYLALLRRENVPREIACDSQNRLMYEACVVELSLEDNLNALEQRPLYYRSSLWLGEWFKDRGNYEVAARYYGQALILVPNSWRIQDELADLYFKLGEPRKSIDLLDRSFELRSGSLEARSWFLKGKAYKKLGELNSAAQAIEMALDGFDEKMSREGFDLLVEVYRGLDISRAEEGYQKFIDRYPDRHNYFSHERALFFNALGMYDEALDILDDILWTGEHKYHLHHDHQHRDDFYHRDKYRAQWEVTRAEVYGKLGLPAQSIEAYKRSIEAYKRTILIVPDDPIYWLELANVYIEVGYKGEAKEAINRASELGLRKEANLLLESMLGVQ